MPSVPSPVITVGASRNPGVGSAGVVHECWADPDRDDDLVAQVSGEEGRDPAEAGADLQDDAAVTLLPAVAAMIPEIRRRTQCRPG
ncbi:hypothetical protein ACIBSV_48325 [Embleya sp. NPDC050154]|uniref:hypothetical protein n=1 Tax=unclassified Embleya TaxID=2699296 RepID=UPI0037A34126